MTWYPPDRRERRSAIEQMDGRYYWYLIIWIDALGRPVHYDCDGLIRDFHCERCHAPVMVVDMVKYQAAQELAELAWQQRQEGLCQSS